MASPRRPSAGNSAHHFTEREQQVLILLAASKTNKEIASQLCLSEKTIRNCVSEMLSKSGLKNRTALAIWAWKAGLVDNQGKNSEIH